MQSAREGLHVVVAMSTWRFLQRTCFTFMCEVLDIVFNGESGQDYRRCVGQQAKTSPPTKRPRRIMAAAIAEARAGATMGDPLQSRLEMRLASLSVELADMGRNLRRQQERIEGLLDAHLIVRHMIKLKRAWDAEDPKEEEE